MVRMKLRPPTLMSKVSEDHCSTRMSRGGKTKVSSDENRTTEFRRSTISNFDIVGVREVP